MIKELKLNGLDFTVYVYLTVVGQLPPPDWFYYYKSGRVVIYLSKVEQPFPDYTKEIGELFPSTSGVVHSVLDWYLNKVPPEDWSEMLNDIKEA